MDDPPRRPDLSDIPNAIPEHRRGWSPQLVWLIPIVAAVIGGGLVVRAVWERGPTITISFKTAEGLEAGKTKIKYKNVDIGEVKQVSLNPDRQVVATAELRKDAATYLVEDTRFWIVRPRIAGGQVSGLGTLFSGSYIGMDIGKSETTQRAFVGLEIAPVVTGDSPGRQFVLVSAELGSLGIGSPVYYRQVEAGSVVAHDLNADGKSVTLRIFVNAPYDRYVTPDTRFWNASGIDVTLDASGIKVDTQSLASILIGGVAFETPPESVSESPAEENRTFILAGTRADAMRALDTLAVPGLLYFVESLRGLSVGAPVDFRGITIGEVKSMNVEFDEAQNQYRFPVGVVIYPRRILPLMVGSSPRMDEPSRRTRWNALVERGLRGQLRTGNLLTGQLYVAMDFFPNAPKAQIDWTKPTPVLPTVPGTMGEVQESLSRLARTLERVPLEDIGTDLRHTLKTLNRTLDSADKLVKRLDAEVAPAARIALDEARRTLNTADQMLASDAPLQHEVREALRELARSGKALRTLAESLERNPESLLQGKKANRR
jgi:paraquat-inducible protein B